MRHSHANRGAAFEAMINHCNMRYENAGIALINKRPTPVKILSARGNRVTACLQQASTVDYDGFYRQRGIAFEAKSIAEGARFPLDKLQQHQFDYLSKAHYIGNVPSFLLVEYAEHRAVFLLPFVKLEMIWKAQSSVRGSRSIHIADMERHGFEVTPGRVPLDYLAAVDHVWGLTAAEAAAVEAHRGGAR
ncbi:Holliday junction resolvase RecU [Cohnella sp. GCM10020058]|uniref:Holliday junction resolvase RecU n=1 Tax=Cohnella sp. GCM10020058 TaxID=3317330 RepID=UPI00363823EC